jgi:biotin carboxylase
MPRVVLLVPSTTYRAADLLHAARAMGVDVVVGTDGDPAPAGALHVDLSDPDATAATVEAWDRHHPVDAVVGVDDRSVLAAARSAERLGLPHTSPAAIADAQDKLRTRLRLAHDEVPQPAFRAVAPDDVAALLDAGAAVGFPCVVKPTTLSASRGVIRADDPHQLEAAARRSAAIARAAGVPPDQPMLVEAFVPGPEVAVEAVLRNGHLSVLAIFDKPDPLDGPYFEETLYVTPSRRPPDEQDAVIAAVRRACASLGLRHGPVHAELRLGGGHPHVVEVAPRTIGGLCGRTVALATGRSLEAVVLAAALGRGVPLARRHRAAGVVMVPPPAPGVIVAVDGVADAAAVPGITSVEVTATPGTTVAPAPDGGRYVAFVFAAGPTPDQVERALRQAWARLTIRLRS